MKDTYNFNYKHILCIFSLTLLFTSFSLSTVKANNQEFIDIYVDNQSIVQKNNPSELPFIENGRTMVPLRLITEYLGFTVHWDAKTETIKLSKDKMSHKLQLNNRTVYSKFNKKDKTSKLETAPKLKNSVTFVPVRFIAESTGADVIWNEKLGNVQIITSKTQTTEIQNQSVSNNNDSEGYLYKNINSLHDEIGAPNQKVNLMMHSIQSWSIFNDNYNDFLMVGTDANNIVYGYYTNNSKHVDKDRDNSNITILEYEDGKTPYAWLVLDSAKYNENVSSTGADPLATEKIQFEQVNAYRATINKKPFIWNDLLAKSARLHSQDMTVNNYFSHNALDSSDAQDRYKRVKPNHGFIYTMAENIYSGNINNYPHDILSAWINSASHRQNLVSDNQEIGMGKYKECWTQVFLTEG